VKREWLEAHAQLLSVPPIFDHSTARTLASRFADALADGAGRRAEEALHALRPACWSASRTRGGWPSRTAR
jgi:hypothetical protein